MTTAARKGWIVLSAVAGGLVALATIQILRGNGDWVPVASLEELEAEGVVYLAEHGVFVVAAEGRVVALSEAVPHVPGDRALFCRSSGWFEEFNMGPSSTASATTQTGPPPGASTVSSSGSGKASSR